MNELPRCTCPAKPVTRTLCAHCARWYDLHAELHVELQLPPWRWPAVTRRTARDAGSASVPGDDAYALMMALDEAARQRRCTGNDSASTAVANSANSNSYNNSRLNLDFPYKV